MRAQNTRVGGKWVREQRQVFEVKREEAGEVVKLPAVEPATVMLVELLPPSMLPKLRGWYATLPQRRLAA